MTAPFDAHLAALFACRLCPSVEGRPVSGPVPDARVLLVGQAPGPREGELGRPFAWTAGKRLFGWFASIGVDEQAFREKVYIAAAIRCFPGRSPLGGDRVPAPEEIARCAAHLDREMTILEPELVLCVGTMAAELIVGKAPLSELVGRTRRRSRAGIEFDAVVLPHPSGRSTWTNQPANRKLLERTLELIRKHPAWRETFGDD